MTILESGTGIDRKKEPPGTVFSVQASESPALVIVHSGIAEILANDRITEGMAADKIIDGSVRIGFVKGEAIIGSVELLEGGQPNPFSFRTMTACTLTIRPMDAGTLAKMMHSDVALSLRVLRSFVTQAETAIYLFRNNKYLWHKIASIADTLALGIPGPEATGKPESVNRKTATLAEYSEDLKRRVAAAGENVPSAWDRNLFLGRIQDVLDLYSDQDANHIENRIDMKQYVFIKRLLKKEDRAVSALFEEDEPLVRYVINFLGQNLNILLRTNESIIREITSLLENLYSDGGWVNEVRKRAPDGNREASQFLHYLAKFSLRFRKDAINLLGLDPLNRFPSFAALADFREVAEVPVEIPVPQGAAGGRLKKYGGLLAKILDFAEMPPEFREELTGMIDSLVAGHPPVSNNDLARMYWEVYERCFLKVIGTDLKGFVPGIMLHLGVLDERLLSEESLLAIDACYAGVLYTDETIPVMTLPYFLEKIYEGETGPSINEMGDSFAYTLKSQKKMTPKEKDRTYIYQDNHDDRVKYELRAVARELQSMLSGNRKTALPFLVEKQFRGPADREFLNPETLVAAITKYRNRDFTMFYREVLLKHELGSDFIQMEVVPDFVLYPGCGSRAIMWQEMDGTRKRTRGRFFFPLFFSENPEDTILRQIANFRWELQKSVAGHNWTDPVEGGLVGAYYDYIAFYRKNPNISPEAKDRLADFIKRTKSDKDRFAEDYRTWVEYEYTGRMRLNPVARDIFYRFCPFPESVRSEMEKRPVFTATATRFRNRREKERIRIENRLMKFSKSGKNLPEELQSYIEFLNS